MPKENQKVRVRTADGSERQLILLRISGQTAYLCPSSRAKEALENPDVAVGFPLADVRFDDAA